MERALNIGDAVVCKGIRAFVQRIHHQEFYKAATYPGEPPSGREDECFLEFYDDNNEYRY